MSGSFRTLSLLNLPILPRRSLLSRMASSVDGSSSSAERYRPSPCKIWTCSVCSRIEEVDIATETHERWPCGRPLKSNIVLEGKACWVDGACDGKMTFKRQATSIYGGGLKSMKLVNHNRRFWGCCSECRRENEFHRIAQPCKNCGGKGIMIIVVILSEQSASRA